MMKMFHTELSRKSQLLTIASVTSIQKQLVIRTAQFLQVFVVVASDMMWYVVCAVRVFLLFFVQVFWEWICCIMWLVIVLFW